MEHNKLSKREALELKLKEKLKIMKKNRSKKDTKRQKNNKINHLNKIEYDIIGVSKDLIKKVARDKQNNPEIKNITLAKRYKDKYPYNQLYKTYGKIFEFIIKGRIKTEEDLNALKNMLLQREHIMNGDIDFDDAQYAMGKQLYDKYGKNLKKEEDK